MKDVQATREPLALKREHPTLHKIHFFTFLWVILPTWIRPELMRIHIDPDPQHRFSSVLLA
jgi:hypothetical protein